MIQARLSTRFSSVLTWVIIISLAFGFCASWSLHFVGMLACKLDLPINLDVGMTMLGAMLAVIFTFAALGSELLWKSYDSKRKRRPSPNRDDVLNTDVANTIPLLMRESLEEDSEEESDDQNTATRTFSTTSLFERVDGSSENSASQKPGLGQVDHDQQLQFSSASFHEMTDHSDEPSPKQSLSSSAHRMDDLEGMVFQGLTNDHNAFVATYKTVYGGMSWKAVLLGLVWSLSITSMHYVGISAMLVPGEGFVTWNPALVLASAMISWAVCILGYIYMSNVEPFLSQQVFLSVLVAVGIASMHFTG